MVTLNEWFENKDYGLGLAILGDYCKNRVLLQNLGRRKNPEKLEYELTKIAKEKGIVFGTVEETTGGEPDGPLPPVEENGEAEPTSEVLSEQLISGILKIVINSREISFDDLPAVMKARWQQNRDSYKEIRSLHEKLKLMENATPEDRQPLTGRIGELDDKIRQNWKEIDAWVPTAEKVFEAIDHKRMQANRKYISTNLKKLAKVTDQVKKAKVVAELQTRFTEVKASGETFAPETIEELAKAGVVC
jgi:hypothetical protein